MARDPELLGALDFLLLGFVRRHPAGQFRWGHMRKFHLQWVQHSWDLTYSCNLTTEYYPPERYDRSTSFLVVV